MAEAAGLALGVVGLFSACIDCYQLVRRGATLDKDFKILETKFNNQELRLSTWGRACGLGADIEYDTRLEEPVLKTRIIATLECIRYLFLDEKELKKRFGLRSWGERSSLLSPARNSPLGIRNGQTSSSESLPRRKGKPFFFWKKQQRSLARFQNRAAWAIYDKEKFSELVQHLKDFNDDLEAMTRPLDGVYVRQMQIVQMEIEEIDDMGTLEEIALASQGDADVISDTVSLRIESIRSGRSTIGPASSGTTKSFKTALTSIPATIDEVLTENSAAQIALPLKSPPRLGAYKCLVVGDYDAGKTRLLLAFSKGYLSDEVYIPTVFENYIAEVCIDGFNILLKLCDTSMQEKYDRLRPLEYPGTHVVLLCFRANNPTAATKSNILETWAPEITHHRPGVPIILVGLNHPDSPDEVDKPDGAESGTGWLRESDLALTMPSSSRTSELKAAGTMSRKYNVEQEGEPGVEELFVPHSIRSKIGAPKYFFCDPNTGFGVQDLLEYAARAAVKFGDGLQQSPVGIVGRIQQLVGSSRARSGA